MTGEWDQLLGTFLDEADEHLSSLEQGLLQVSEGTPNLELLNALFRAAHSIKGGSGVFGFDAVTRLTHALEQLLDRLRKGQLAPSRDRIDLLLRSLDGLSAMFVAARQGSAADVAVPDEMIRALFEAAGVELEHKATAVTGVAESVAERAGPRQYSVSVKPAPQLLDDGMDPLVLLRNLSKRGEVLNVVADIGSIPPLDEIDWSRCYLSWVITIRTEEPPEDLKDVFSFVEECCAVEVIECPMKRNKGTDGSGFQSIASINLRIAEYEANLHGLLDWMNSRLPGLRRLATEMPGVAQARSLRADASN